MAKPVHSMIRVRDEAKAETRAAIIAYLKELN